MQQPSLSEQLAVLTALQNMIKDRLAEVRAQADGELVAAYEDDGVTKKALKVGNIKVGDYLVVMTKGEWEIADADLFNDFALAYGLADYQYGIRPEYMHSAIKLLGEQMPDAVSTGVKLAPDWQNYITNTGGTATFMDSGEPVPGLRYCGPRVKCTQVRGCKPEAVVPVLQSLGGLDRLLLGEPGDSYTTD